MSYDLYNPTTMISRTFSRQSWTKALELAKDYGWKARGTRPPSNYDFYKLGADWQGTYLTNDAQTVSAEDAASLAAALGRSLEDIRDTNLPANWNAQLWLEDDQPEWLSPEEKEIIEDGLQEGLVDVAGMNPLDYFAGDEKHSLAGLIRFCRMGSFVIS